MGPLFELCITTAGKGSREVASHLFRQLKSAILDKRLPPGSRLPSTREAKRVFGVSRNTAQDVYDRLAQEGLLSTRHGSGTYVRVPADSIAAPASDDGGHRGSVSPFWERSDIAAWIGFWQERASDNPGSGVLADLRPALVDQRLFPHAIFRQTMARQLRQLETQSAPSRSPQGNKGNGRLRRAIAEHLGVTRALACGRHDVLVTSGAQQAFDLIARVLVRRGETVVAVEDPGYPPIRVPFAAAGARLVPVPVDGSGIIVERIPPEAKIICVCPSHQFPLGMTMSRARREELLRFARANGAVIVEDDYDGEFRYGGSPLDALRGSASADHVFYVGSFSKCMFSAIRLGFVVPPTWALPALVAAKNASDWHSAVPIQAAVAGFIEDGHLARHIRRMRRIYLERRERLTKLLRERIGQAVTVVPSSYGMHLTAMARPDVDCEAVSEALAERGIMIHSLARYYLDPAATRGGFILGYAAADLDEIAAAVDALAGMIAGSSSR